MGSLFCHFRLIHHQQAFDILTKFGTTVYMCIDRYLNSNTPELLSVPLSITVNIPADKTIDELQDVGVINAY